MGATINAMPLLIDPAEVAGAAEGLRAVLAHINEDESELTATPATRRRIEGAITSLETLVNERLTNDR